jgi:transcriptional regulator with XRE-family HTH domain
MEISVDLQGYLDSIESYHKAAAATVGRQLRECRIAQGLTLNDIIGETRINRHHLEAIEQGNYIKLPGGKDLLEGYYTAIYVKNFIRSYARCIGFAETISFEIREVNEAHALDVVAAPSTSVYITKNHRPPKFGEYLLYLFLTKAERVYLIGDLAEEYDELSSRFGRQAANLWYYRQIVTSLRPLMRRLLCRARTVILILEIIQKLRSH